MTETSVVYWTGDLTQRVLEQSPLCVADSGQDVAAVFANWGRGLPFIEELTSGGLISYQGLIKPYN